MSTLLSSPDWNFPGSRDVFSLSPWRCGVNSAKLRLRFKLIGSSSKCILWYPTSNLYCSVSSCLLESYFILLGKKIMQCAFHFSKFSTHTMRCARKGHEVLTLFFLKSDDDVIIFTTCVIKWNLCSFWGHFMWSKSRLLSKPVVPSSQTQQQSLHGFNDAASLTRSSQM